MGQGSDLGIRVKSDTENKEPEIDCFPCALGL